MSEAKTASQASEEPAVANQVDSNPAETQEWVDSLEYVLQSAGTERVQYLLNVLDSTARRNGVDLPIASNTPYINTIPPDQQPAYPGNREIERRIKSIIRWNAMAMVQLSLIHI